MMRIDNIYKITCLAMVLLLVSCAKVHLFFRAEPGFVRITPDQTAYALPALEYHFYNIGVDIDGQLVDADGQPIVFPSDENGNFAGELPAGVYRVIATNTAIKANGNVDFEMVGGHGVANVYALPAGTGATVNYYKEPDSVYSVIEELTVVSFDTISYEPAPVLLTRTVRLRFILGGELATSGLTALNGVLRGVCPVAYLYDRSVKEETDREVIEASAMTFNAEATETGNEWEASLSLFGIQDPKYDAEAKQGTVYDNILSLTLTWPDGPEEINVPMSKVLSEWFEENKNNLPLEIPLKIDISRVPFQAAVAIASIWGGEVEGEVNEK